MESQRPMSVVDIGLINLPTEKYKRNVVRGKLDLVGKCFLFASTSKPNYNSFSFINNNNKKVSFGGSASLFLGCSLLSFVEVIFFFFVRPYGLPAEDIDNTENKSESTGGKA